MLRSCLAVLSLTTLLLAQTPAASAPTGTPGTRLLAGGGRLPPEIFARFLELAGGEHAKVVLIPTASQTADDAQENEDTLRLYRERLHGAEITLLHTRDRAVADDEAFCAPLARATGVWMTGGAQDRLASAYLGTRVERELMALLARGGVVGGTSAGTAIQTRMMIQEGMDPPVMATGFDFVPGAISDQHFLKRQRLPRLLRALAMHPGLFGIGVDEGTAVEIDGRDLQMRVLGASKSVLVLAATNGHAEVVREFAARSPAEDLRGWQRAASRRAAWELPATFAPPKVEAGTLVLGGRGNLDSTAAKLLELAGGADAKIVVFDVDLEPWESPFDRSFAQLLQELGARNVHRAKAGPARCVDAVPPEDLALLQTADAVWLDHTMVAADSAAAAAIRGVLARGGVVGGGITSWSAPFGDIQCATDTAHPEISYERGLGLLPGCAITTLPGDPDLVRKLAGLWTCVPQVLGIALPQDAAAIVRGSELEVLGTSPITLHPVRGAGIEGTAIHLEPGVRYDLVTGARR